ncbi:MAG: polyprenyl synthetase family protein [Candidatus Binatia bacterium]
MDAAELNAYLDDCRDLTLQEIRSIVPTGRGCRSALYDLMLDYPLRAAKALRPSLCIATCRALGGRLESVLRSAAVLELYHNAFLLHDDVEDGSENRRGRPTLHASHGMPVAVNVGDAMLALVLQPLLDNMRLLGMGKALRILQVIARMARESTEGQALELHWIQRREWRLADSDYARMVYKKTSWYSFITPMLVGGIVAGLPAESLATLRRFAALLGIAFQIQDDILNLTAEGDVYGKEIAGDLWEGKHTLIVMHMMRAATERERDRARTILCKPRPPHPNETQRNDQFPPTALAEVLTALAASGHLTAEGRHAIDAVLPQRDVDSRAVKTPVDVEFLGGLIDRYGSIQYARAIAVRLAQKVDGMLARRGLFSPSIHRDFLQGLVNFVVTRDR